MNLKDICIILVKPQMGENIGATARVMKNFGLSDLRIVSPRDGWPNAKAHEMSANADDIIENAKIYDNIENAVADMNIVFATASKQRDIVKEVVTPSQVASIISEIEQKAKIGIIFGKESSGLENEDISHCNYLVSIPVSPEYDSLNLAQAVCVLGYELFKGSAGLENQSAKTLEKITIKQKWQNKIPSPLTGEGQGEGDSGKAPHPSLLPQGEKAFSSVTAQSSFLAERKDINDMLNFLEKELTEKNFFQVPEKKPGMLVNIRNIFTRHFYTEQEVRTLRGIFNVLKK